MTSRTLPAPVSTRGGHHNKGRKLEPQAFTDDEILALLRASRQPWGGHQIAERYAQQRFALIVVAWRSGLRAAELLDLEERDLNPERHSVTVRNGKGGKRRTAKMDPWAWKQIAPYCEYRASLPVGKLFCSLRTGEQGQQISTERLRQLCHELGRRANLRRRVHPHAFRHTHAVDLYRAGVPLFGIMV